MRVLQGESERAGENRELGTFDLVGIRLGRKGEAKIEVKSYYYYLKIEVKSYYYHYVKIEVKGYYIIIIIERSRSNIII